MTHQIFVQLQYSIGLIAVTFFIHAVAIILGRTLFIHPADRPRKRALVGDTVRLVFLSVFLFVAHGAAVFVWAMLFSYVGLNPSFEEAVYFALTCYTTLGFGDIVPATDWRLLAGTCSANGLLLFGLSAAILVDATERMRRRQTI